MEGGFGLEACLGGQGLAWAGFGVEVRLEGGFGLEVEGRVWLRGASWRARAWLTRLGLTSTRNNTFGSPRVFED